MCVKWERKGGSKCDGSKEASFFFFSSVWLPDRRHWANGCREEGGANINCNSRLPVYPTFFLPSQPKVLSPNTLSRCYTHTRTSIHTHIPSERDGSVTIGKQRLLVTENALRLEPGQPSAGRGSDGITPVLGHRAGERWATSSPPPLAAVNCPDLQARPPGIRVTAPPLPTPPSLTRQTLDSS